MIRNMEDLAGTTCKIKVTEVINPANFCAQIGSTQKFIEFTELEDHINQFGSSYDESEVTLEALTHGQIVLVQDESKWRRAQIVGTDELDAAVDVQLIDYKSTCRVTVDQIKVKIPEAAYTCGSFAQQCRLAGIKPVVGKIWIGRSVQEFSELVLDQMLDCEVFGPDEGQQQNLLVLDIFLVEEDAAKSVADKLIESGVGIAFEDPIAQPKPSEVFIPMFDVETINNPPAQREQTTEESDTTEDEDVEIAEMKARLCSDFPPNDSQNERLDEMLSSGGVSRYKSSYDQTIEIHNIVSAAQSGCESGFSDNNPDPLLSPATRRGGRGRSKRSQTHSPKVGHACRNLNNQTPDPKDTSSPYQQITPSGEMPMQRYGFGEPRKSHAMQYTEDESRRGGGGGGDFENRANSREAAVPSPSLSHSPYSSGQHSPYPDDVQNSSRSTPQDTYIKPKVKGRGRQMEEYYQNKATTQIAGQVTGQVAGHIAGAEQVNGQIAGQALGQEAGLAGQVPGHVAGLAGQVPGHVAGLAGQVPGHVGGARGQKERQVGKEDSRSSPYDKKPPSYTDFRKRYGNDAPSEQELKNEYEWRSTRIKNTISKLMDEDFSDHTLEELEAIIFPDESPLTGLPGSGEFVIFLHVLISTCVENYSDKLKNTLCYVSHYQDELDFQHEFVAILLEKGEEYVVPSTATQHARHYALTVAQLWRHLGQWQERSADVMNACVRQLMDQWALVAKRNVPEDLHGVYAECLVDLFHEAGPLLLNIFPTDTQLILTTLEDALVGNNKLGREVKESYLKILLLNNSWQTQATPVKRPKEKKKPVTSIKETQTDNRIEMSPNDQYACVKKMLQDLSMEQLYDTFKENAVRDAAIFHIEISEVKDLLKEIGLKAGQIIEIKSYVTHSEVPKTRTRSMELYSPSLQLNADLSETTDPSDVHPSNTASMGTSENGYDQHISNGRGETMPFNNFSNHEFAEPSYASQVGVNKSKKAESAKYIPPNARNSNNNVEWRDDPDETPSAFHSIVSRIGPAGKPVAPPPGFAPVMQVQDEKPRAKGRSRADKKTNWRQKTDDEISPPKDVTHNGRHVSLGKTSSHSNAEKDMQIDRRQVLAETESYIAASQSRTSFVCSPPSYNPPTSHVYQEEFPSLHDTLGVGPKKPSADKAVKPQKSSSKLSLSHEAPVFVPLAAKKQFPDLNSTFSPIRQCCICGSDNHDTHTCPDRAQKFFV